MKENNQYHFHVGQPLDELSGQSEPSLSDIDRLIQLWIKTRELNPVFEDVEKHAAKVYFEYWIAAKHSQLGQRIAALDFENLIEDADSNARIFEIANELANLFLIENEPMPECLSEWTTERLRGSKRRPSVRGPKAAKYDDWDFNICLLVGSLRFPNVPTTRNSARPQNSICDPVAANFCISYENVVRIWQASGRFVLAYGHQFFGLDGRRHKL